MQFSSIYHFSSINAIYEIFLYLPIMVDNLYCKSDAVAFFFSYSIFIFPFSIKNKAEGEIVRAQAILSNDGSVKYIPYQHIETPCEFNLIAFPFDKQRCIIKLGSYHTNGATVRTTTNHC